MPACRSLDCITMLTGDVADVRLLDGLLSGFDAADPLSRIVEKRPRVLTSFGVPLPHQRLWSGDAASERLYGIALDRLAAAGAAAVEIDLAPLNEAARLLYHGPWLAKRTAAIEPLLRAHSEATHSIVGEIVEAGAGMSAVDSCNGIYHLAERHRQALRLWNEVDLLALPMTDRVRHLVHRHGGQRSVAARRGRDLPDGSGAPPVAAARSGDAWRR